MNKVNPLRGEERRVISTKLYRPEFANFAKICESENKSVHAKLREMIGEEIERNLGNVLAEKKDKLDHRTINKVKADFSYAGMMNFDSMPENSMMQFEKIRYIKGILPRIEDIKKEIKINKKPNKKEKVDSFKFLMNSKANHRNFTFEYENGETYPKDIDEPDIRMIQYAEPHILITDWYDEDKNWYHMHNLIRSFAEESYLSYQNGLFLSSISSAINCCEYLLKYEYIRNLNKSDKLKAEEKSNDKGFSLGSFTFVKNPYLKDLNIEQYRSEIEYINDVRVSLYHFSPDREKKAKAKGNVIVEKIARLSDDMVIPIVAYRVYSIMAELINHFYGKENLLKYVEEGVGDWMKKRGLNKEDLLKEMKK